MNLTLTLHLAAGLAAAGLGAGILLREPARARNRAFAWLCGALALWNLGYVGMGQADRPEAWRGLFLLGSCATAPLALHFALVLAGVSGGLRRGLLVPAWLLAGGLWVASWFSLGDLWYLLAIAIIGGILTLALGALGRHARSLPVGPEKRALQLVFWGAVVAALGGLSDLVPGGLPVLTELGPPSLLAFLLVVCAVIVRHRFLDVDVFLIRAVALIAGAAGAALVFFAVVHLVDPGARFVSLFLAAVAVLALAVPVVRLLAARARGRLAVSDPVAEALLEISRRLPQAESAERFWECIAEGRRLLPGDAAFDVWLRREGQRRFRLIHRSVGRPQASDEPLADEAPLPRLLGAERLPLTRRYLEAEQRESRGERLRLAGDALEAMRRGRIDLVVPLLRGERLVGWIAAGGLPAERMTAELAAAFMAVGHQAAASLERIETLEQARRQEALAAVGELSAGLAHELRNPVSAIRGAAQALGPQATPEQEREMLEVIGDESARLERVVAEFLDYARPGSSRREPVRPGELVRRCLRGAELGGRALAAEVHEDPASPLVVGDPDRLQRAFDNLIRNAWEAAGAGGRLEVDIRPEGADRVAIRFEDSGPGIPPEQLERLFRPFWSTKPGGTGLGLALVHRVVDEHGGEIRVDGRPGLGAAFTVLLPRAATGGDPG